MRNRSAKPSWERWSQALAAYRFPLNLSRYGGRHRFPDWFLHDLGKGDREETMAFEARFRDHASTHIEAWYEVVFWKLGGAGPFLKTLEWIINQNLSPADLWERCNRYVQSESVSPDEHLFRSFLDRFGFKSERIAVAATFPAVLCPERFPMVDKHVANWVKTFHLKHNSADCDGPQLIPPKDPNNLSMKDWEFVASWTRWCRHTAEKLRSLGPVQPNWRARDVEMAVFQAQRDGRGDLLPSIPPIDSYGSDGPKTGTCLDFEPLKVTLGRRGSDRGNGAQGGWYRAKVPGGWLVLCYGQLLSFVPDPRHEWTHAFWQGPGR